MMIKNVKNYLILTRAILFLLIFIDFLYIIFSVAWIIRAVIDIRYLDNYVKFDWRSILSLLISIITIFIFNRLEDFLSKKISKDFEKPLED